jgi:uncharacterized tellurite resistance protein B-like protein
MSGNIIGSRLDGDRLVVETAEGIDEYDTQFLVAALLVAVARSSGEIAPEESAQMIGLLEEQFDLQGPESLELLTRAMTEMIEKPQLGTLLADLAPTLSDSDKEDIAFMALKVVAADGHREFREIEQFDRAMDAVGISAEIIHKAYDRYFSETMSGSEGDNG